MSQQDSCVETRLHDVLITNDKTGETVFRKDGFEIPKDWSDSAADICAKLYSMDYENSALEVIDRVVNQITDWGREQGYFNVSTKSVHSRPLDYGESFKFKQELRDIFINQRASMNSPVLINIGVPEHKAQASACFVMGVEDNMEDILEHVKREGLVFKNGSGVGINISSLRAKGELLSNKGRSSGPLGFLKGYDSFAGSIKSGGRSRRAARLCCMDTDHPDVMDFIECKKLEEDKAKMLMSCGVSPEEAYSTVAHQNANHSIRVSDEFMQACLDGKDWHLINRGDGKVARTLPAKDILRRAAEIAHETGDPGIQFQDRVNVDNPVPSMGEIVSSNPCFTGDTLVAVADGRGMVSFKDLAERGTDVLTYTVSSKGKLKVANMSNPRLTRKNAKVFKVTFDSGLEVKATEDHKFLTSDGDLTPLKDLKEGSSIKSMVKHQMRFKDAVPYKTSYKGQDYYSWENNGSLVFDHRLIAEYKNKGPIQRGKVVHHRDYNALNNGLLNLEIMDRDDHNRIHSEHMKGENNPVHKLSPGERAAWLEKLSVANKGEKNSRYNGVSNEEVVEIVKDIASKALYGYFTKRMWLESDLLPAVSSPKPGGYRKAVSEYAKEAGVDYISSEHYDNIIRRHDDLVKSGYDFTYDKPNKKFVIKKICEETGEAFYVNYNNRHVSYKDNSALQTAQGRKKVRFLNGKINEKYLDNANVKRRLKDTLEMVEHYRDHKDDYTNLKKEYGAANTLIRHSNIFCPTVKYLKKHCMEISCVEDLIRLAEENLMVSGVDPRLKSTVIGDSYNHKVVKVEYFGVEDVYDGTVEGEHLILVGGQELKNKYDKPCYHFVVTAQCSEYFYINNGSCNLASLNLAKYYLGDNNYNWQQFQLDIHNIITAMDILIDKSYFPTEEIREVTTKTRPLGLGFANLGGLLMSMGLPYDSPEARKVAAGITKRMTTYAYERSCELASKLGPFEAFEENRERCLEIAGRLISNAKIQADMGEAGVRNSQLTLLAPTGSIGILMDCDSFGVEPLWALEGLKTLSDGSTMKLTPDCVKGSLDKLGVGSIDELSDHQKKIFKTANDISWKDHIRMLAEIQPHLSSGVSKTINMPNDCTIQDMEDAYIMAWREGLKAVAVYRDGSKQLQPLTVKKEIPELVVEKIVETPKLVLPDEIVLPQTVRLKLPDERASRTHKFSISGYEGYITVGLYDNGTPGEMFLRMSKEGSMVSGLVDSFATVVSLALQYGVPLSHLIDKLENVRFEPAGLTMNPEIPLAKSITDYVAKWLKIRFLEETEEDEDEDEDADYTDTVVQIPPMIVDSVTPSLDCSGTECPQCGGITVPSGTCFTCTTCGASTGCG